MTVALALTMAAAMPMVSAGAATSPGQGPSGLSLEQARTAAAKIDDKVAAALDAKPRAHFLVQVRGSADLSGIPRRGDRTARIRAVLKAKQDFAERSQAEVRELLREAGASYRPYWISNLIEVDGDEQLATDLALRQDVVRLVPNQVHQLPKPTPRVTGQDTQAVGWDVSQIRADRVWSELSTTGAGVVVANIDTGADYTHPALAASYRGNLGDGRYDHDYNWFDPAKVCADPSTAPCDNNGHGTHTMGTMVGDDGGENRVGVAPGARWIAAKGCETSGCSTESLLAAGQWVVAPTDLAGNNPRPDLAPDVVNNSWGGGVGDNPWYQELVNTWVAAGIFPVFSAGNAGGACNTDAAPGNYANAYSVGAVDVDGRIASFSSRGPGADGETKPNIAAPGVGIRSSTPGGGYESWDGTSMAAPHVAGVVALLWSYAPALAGDVQATRQLLDVGAIDSPDAQCGGPGGDNNVFGEGRLDAFATVQRGPHGPTGTLTGTVVSGGDPVANATVTVTGQWETFVRTDAQGRFTFGHLSVGDYRVDVSGFGYLSQRLQAQVTEGETTSRTVELTAAPTHRLTVAVVESDGTAVPGAVVTVADTPIPAGATGADGRVAFDAVPSGEYEVTADFGRWLQPVTKEVAVSADRTERFVLPAKTDAYGITAARAEPDWVDTSTVLPLTGDDDRISVDLPFPVTFYDRTYTQARVSTNGYLVFAGDAYAYANDLIPSGSAPNAAVYALWDDLFVDADASIRTATVGTGTDRRFVVEWHNVTFLADRQQRIDVQAVLAESGEVLIQYRGIDPAQALESGGSATVGVEDADGAVGLQYIANQPVLRDSEALRLHLPGAGILRGTVTDANDQQPVADATVTARAGATTRRTRTDADGLYQVQLPAGPASVEVTATGYTTTGSSVSVRAAEVVTEDLVPTAPRLVADPASLEFVTTPGGRRQATVTVRNTGTATGTWTAREAGGGLLPADPEPGPDPGPEGSADPDAPAGAGGSAGDAREDQKTGSGTAVSPKPVEVVVTDPDARTSRGVRREAATLPAVTVAGTGDVLGSFPLDGQRQGWGAGFDGDLWVSDFYGTQANHRYSPAGQHLGQFPFTGGEWGADLAHVPGRDLMCQVTVGGDNAIRCWRTGDGSLAETITGPWTNASQRGLAYRPDDDTFYVGGWNSGTIYHIQGLSHPDPGAVISQCQPVDWTISGLAWSPRGTLWQTGNSEHQVISGLNPETCATVTTLPFPTVAPYSGAGLEADGDGNLWTVGQDAVTFGPSTAYLVDSGLPNFTEVPWLSQAPSSGTVAPGQSRQFRVDADSGGLATGVHGATLFLVTDSPRQPVLGIPVRFDIRLS